MAGCVPCFVLPLLLFIFHRYIQPILLKIWNPWEKLPKSEEKMPSFSECPCRKNGGDTSSDGESCQLVRGDKKESVDSNGESCQFVGKEKSA